jgi:hypothetical protein
MSNSFTYKQATVNNVSGISFGNNRKINLKQDQSNFKSNLKNKKKCCQ